MTGQITLEEYLKSRRKIFPTCGDCVCRSCLYWWSSRCPYGGCWDDHRAETDPYDAAHPDKPPREYWSDWDKPGGANRTSDGTAESIMDRMAHGFPNWMDGDLDFIINHYWDDEPGIPRVTTGINHRVDRLKCLGNAVVPQQFYPIFRAIIEIERSKEC